MRTAIGKQEKPELLHGPGALTPSGGLPACTAITGLSRIRLSSVVPRLPRLVRKPSRSRGCSQFALSDPDGSQSGRAANDAHR